METVFEAAFICWSCERETLLKLVICCGLGNHYSFSYMTSKNRNKDNFVVVVLVGGHSSQG